MIADVTLPIPVGKFFSYSVPVDIAPYIAVLSRVRVPFHQRDAIGTVVGLREGDDPRLKAIIEPLDFFPLIDNELSALAGWASSFYLTPSGLVMKYALPPLRDIERYLIIGQTNNTSIKEGTPLNKMVKKLGHLRLVQLFVQGAFDLRDTFTRDDFTAACTGDSQTQGLGARSILFTDSLERRFERYISLIGSHIEKNGNILFFLPDHYAAGSYFADRLTALYGERVLWFSSGVPVKKRMETYFRTRREGGYVVLGNKSLVFLPARNVSLIIVERCDDDEYRNEESFTFNAARTAVERTRLKGIPFILGSAVCSIDTMAYARENEVILECNEWLAAKGPTVKNVGSRSSGELLDRVRTDAIATVQRGGKVAVYAPRKEYGSFLRCHGCREDLTCAKCGGHLEYDRARDVLLCTGCASQYPYSDTCPHCGSNMIEFARIGASFIYDHLSRTAPWVGATIITGDSLKKELSALRKSPDRAACLVGTQALSKMYGHHVDRLILADWEELRKMSGFRSEEKTHQVICNLIDALTPDEIISHSRARHPADLAPYLKITDFYENELKKRKEADFPPFTRIFLVEARAKTQPAADRALAKVTAVISAHGLNSHIFGTVPGNKPPFHTWKTILKGPKDLLTKAFTDLYNIPGVEIEADPPNF
jgi:primosomal protein N' (replication factor Y)